MCCISVCYEKASYLGVIYASKGLSLHRHHHTVADAGDELFHRLSTLMVVWWGITGGARGREGVGGLRGGSKRVS